MDRPAPVGSGDVQATFPIKSVETLVFATTSVAAGTFRCAPDHALFADSGPSSTYCFVFPRTSVWIRHVASTPFVGSPALTAFYNQGQEYGRRKVSADGDRSDWFAVAPAIIEDIQAAIGVVSVRGSRRLFDRPYVACEARLYLKQRRLQERLARGDSVDPLGVEETIVGMLETLLSRASEQPLGREPITGRYLDLANDTTALLASRVRDRLHLADLAAALDCSVFHLCRTFRRVTGFTIHQFRSQLRLRLALEAVVDAQAHDLTAIALDLGYSSHSHFTSQFRQVFRLTPSAFIELSRRRWR